MVDVALYDAEITLTGPAAGQVGDALVSPPRLHLSATVASTLTLDVSDPDHDLRDVYLGVGAVTDHTRWGVAAIRRAGLRTRLVLEPMVVLALRAGVAAYSVPAGSTTITELVERVGHEAGVPVAVDPSRHTVAQAVRRDGDAWVFTSMVAQAAGRWRYCDGTALVVASPRWLLDQAATASSVTAAAVGGIDYTTDVGLPLESAAADVDPTVWLPRLGEPTVLDDAGAASGRWLVTEYRATLGEGSGRVVWTRPQRGSSW